MVHPSWFDKEPKKYEHYVDVWTNDTDRILNTLGGEKNETKWLKEQSAFMTSWCKENCVDEWAEEGLMEYSFANSKDAMLFKLRWLP